MHWDNRPIYRRRRRLVAGVAGLTVVGVIAGGTAVSKALDDETPPVANGTASATTARGKAATTKKSAKKSVKPKKRVTTSTPTASASSSTITSSATSAAPVVHKRTGAAPDITLAFAGDVSAEGSAARLAEVGLGATGDVLAKADLAMLNLETVVVQDPTGLRREPKPYTFITDPTILTTLQNEGIDVVTAANNHGMDFGAEGMERMLAVKATSALPIVGIGRDDAEAWAPWTTQVKGRKVVIFGATDVLDDHLDWKAAPGKPGLAKIRDEAGFAKLVDAVKTARAAGPDAVIVVYLHSGIELTRCPTPRQRYTDSTLAAAGADVVVGSHAHQVQTTTTQGNTAIAYGLGNFVFAAKKVETTTTGVLTVTVPGANGAPTMTFDPARIRNGVPELVTGAERKKALASFANLGQGCS